MNVPCVLALLGSQPRRDLRDRRSRLTGASLSACALDITDLPVNHLVLKSGRRTAEEPAMTDSPKVLVADDEPHLLRLVKFRLEREGYQVVTAPDGQAALELARSEQPDLCVLDVMMPKRSGFDVLRELRSDSSART